VERTGEDGIALEKKSLHARERDTEANQQQQQTFLETLARRAPEKLMFLDESGVTTQMTRLHGRAPRGERIAEATPQGHWKVLTTLGTMSVRGIEAVMIIDKAVYAYPVEHYEYWRKQLPDVSFSWGVFGENLTTEGLSEDTLCIGDLVRAGSAILQVTQPRMPCYKLELRFNRDDMIKRFLVSGRSGFYFSVIEPGDVGVGSQVEVLDRDTNNVTISDILRLYVGQTPDPEQLRRMTNVTSLPENWKTQLQLRAQKWI
jgi:MOSC domain-containing protein YiiM